MKLKSVQINEFRSVRDSKPFEIGQVTCLVGKNESGKSSLLQALYRLNPIVDEHATYNVTDDYPRTYVTRYKRQLTAGDIEPATVATATFALEPADLEPIAQVFRGVITKNELTISRGYSNTLDHAMGIDEAGAVSALLNVAVVTPELKTEVLQAPTVKNLVEALKTNASSIATRKAADLAAANALPDDAGDGTAKADALKAANSIEEPKKTAEWRAWLEKNLAAGLDAYLWKHLQPRIPRFLYFDEYYQMEGHVNIPALKRRQDEKKLLDSDRPMLGLIDLADLPIDQLISPPNTQDLINNLEGASNDLTRQIMPYWSQNKHIELRFDIRPGAPGDPEGMREGMNLWATVYDSAHHVTVRVGTRSRGFIWFFSFLAWFSQHQKSKQPIVLLLDEPGLFLHASAQADLLRFIEVELEGHHQVIYSTHSPFMIDAKHFERVRLVRDASLESDTALPEETEGTKVYSDPLEVDPGTLFPLQGALAYDITQTLFVGPHSLLVEGVSELVYLPTLSSVLAEHGRTQLDARWTLSPVGGADKAASFVALFQSQKGLNVATLLDVQKKDEQKIENLKARLRTAAHVLTFADFVPGREADVEDMFDPDFYVALVNAAFAQELVAPLELATLPPHSRVVVRIEMFLKSNPLKGNVGFNHFRPASYLARNLEALKPSIPAATLDRFEAAFTALNGLL